MGHSSIPACHPWQQARQNIRYETKSLKNTAFFPHTDLAWLADANLWPQSSLKQVDHPVQSPQKEGSGSWNESYLQLRHGSERATTLTNAKLESIRSLSYVHASVSHAQQFTCRICQRPDQILGTYYVGQAAPFTAGANTRSRPCELVQTPSEVKSSSYVDPTRSIPNCSTTSSTARIATVPLNVWSPQLNLSRTTTMGKLGRTESSVFILGHVSGSLSPVMRICSLNKRWISQLEDLNQRASWNLGHAAQEFYATSISK